MRLMFVTPSLSNGGAERVVAQLSSLMSHEHDVLVACTWPTGNANGIYDIDPRVSIHEVEVRFSRMPRGNFDSYHMERKAIQQQLRELKRAWRPDASTSFLTKCNYDNVRSCTGERTVVSIRNILAPSLGEDYRAPKWVTKHIISRAGRRADRVVCVSRNVMAEQHELFGVPSKKTSVIYNPVDIERVRSLAELESGNDAFERFCSTHSTLLGSMGRLTEQKGQQHLLRAFAEARKSCSRAGIVLLGEGPLQEELEQLARALGVSDHVFFAGFCSNPFAYLTRCSAFVLSSLREGFSNALLEAAALGLPIISTDCNSGPRELLAPETDPSYTTGATEHATYGILTPRLAASWPLPNAPLEHAERELAQAITELLLDESARARYGKLAAKRATDFAPAAIAAEWEGLFESLAKGGARS